MKKNHKQTKYVNKAKILFSLFVVAWISTLLFVANDRTLEKRTAQIERELQYFRYKLVLSGENKTNVEKFGAVFLGALGVLKGPATISYSTASQNSLLNAQAIPVFVYHGIVDEPDRFSHSKKMFEEHMFALKNAGYVSITTTDLLAFLDGEKELPEKSFLLTFDDGRRDSYEGSDSILKAFDWSAVMFVATGQSLKPSESGYYLGISEIQKMAESGRWEIGSHAVQGDGGHIQVSESGIEGNFLSNKMWLATKERYETDKEYVERVRDEFSVSKNEIMKFTGQSVVAFSYPFGDYGQQSKNYLDKAEEIIADELKENYNLAFFQAWPRDSFHTFNYVGDHGLTLRRIEPGTDWSGSTLINYLAQASPKNIPYSSSLTRNVGWKNNWGRIGFSENGMTLVTTTTTSGSFAFLEGTKHWEDYFYTVKASLEKGGYFTLFARYQDANNYASCTFGEDYVKVEQKINGVISDLIDTKNPISVPRDNGTYSVLVDGSQIKCYEGGAVAIVSYRLDESINSGGIGARVWDSSLNNGQVTLHSLSVFKADNASDILKTLPLYERP